MKKAEKIARHIRSLYRLGSGKFPSCQLIFPENRNVNRFWVRFSWLCASCLIFWLAASLINRSLAHEVWIEPAAPYLSLGEELLADLRIGDMFSGDHLIYIPQQTERLLILTAGGSLDLTPRVGTRPVISVPAKKLADYSGNLVAVYQSANSYAHYSAQEKFFSFAEKKGASGVRQAHKSRQLPDSGFVERYKRFAKAIITIGPAGGKTSGKDGGMIHDRIVGMELEFLLLGKTRLSPSRQTFRFQLLYQGDLLPGAQVTLFSRDRDGAVASSKVMTDEQGAFSVVAEAGHRYLVDHVTLRHANPARDRKQPVWESLWTSYTFAGPEL
jgi:uncharacterized GH25 family protein